MSEKDVEAVRQILESLISVHTAQIDGKFEVIKNELQHIKEQTTRTNGRVNKHDEQIRSLREADIQHIIDCPVESRIVHVESGIITEIFVC